jgi:hypothetical protein
MTFRYFVRCAALVAVALVGAGCSSGALPAPTPASTQGPSSGATHGAGTTAGLTATGTVTVRSGGKVVCVMTIKDGKGTCKVSTKDYKPGTLSFTGAYSGGDGMKASVSKPLAVRLLPTPKDK